MKRILTTLALAGALLLTLAPSFVAVSQNMICPTAAHGTSDNRCASTAFVQQEIGQAAGGTNGQIQYNNGGAFGGFTWNSGGDITLSVPSGNNTINTSAVTTAKIADQNVTTTKIADQNVTTAKIADGNVTNAKLAPGAANTVKGSLNGSTTSDLAIASCSAIYQFTQWVSGTGWRCGLIPVLPSRATAVGLNLSAFGSIITLGYSLPGDGGAAPFYNNAGAITGIGVTTGGSACTNGPNAGIYFTGGNGRRAQGTVTVSGGVATAVATSGTGGQGLGYLANDVLTAVNVPGCSVQPTFTVSAVGPAAFIDAQVTGTNINATGSGCTNGTYYGEWPLGGNGNGLQGNATISGNILTNFTITGTGGGGYRVNDTLNFTASSPAFPGCGTQPSLTVATINSPLGSFTDAGSIGWQINPNANNGIINVLQFGAVANYIRAEGDASATNSQPGIQAALRFAAVGDWFPDSGGYAGGFVLVPSGAYLVCNGLLVPANVTFSGTVSSASVLKQCDADSLASNFVTLGDPLNRQAAFNANIRNMTLFGSGGSTGTGYMIYTNSQQSAYSVDAVNIYAVARGCIKYDNVAYGGNTGFGVHGGVCVPNNALTPSPAVSINGNFSFTFDNDWHVSVGGTKWAGTAIATGNGGTVLFNGTHCENLSICISYDSSGTSPAILHVLGNIGNIQVDRYVSIKTGSVANGVNMQNFNANSTVCSVYKEATTTCVSSGNVYGSSTF